jgi:hypothetical protein
MSASWQYPAFKKPYLSTMKKWLFVGAIVLITGLGVAATGLLGADVQPDPGPAGSGGFAVVELFTSQGCSSCPAADRLLNAIIEEANQTGQPVFGLSFHVSYWDYLGWKDPYASTSYNVRQGNYVTKLKAGNAYTPQMVVNGKTEFVGSSPKESEAAIKAALVLASSFNLQAQSTITNSQLKTIYQLDNMPGLAVVNVALVRKEVQNHVPRGENRGRTLTHKNVVTRFITADAKRSGEVTFDLPDDFDKDENVVVVYLQNKNDLAITAACQVTL